jgi:hypothetical protein
MRKLLLPWVLFQLIRCVLPWNMRGAELPGVGQLHVCRAHATVHFRPDLEDARWHLVPVTSDELLSALCQARDPFEAMAVLRAAGVQ